MSFTPGTVVSVKGYHGIAFCVVGYRKVGVMFTTINDFGEEEELDEGVWEDEDEASDYRVVVMVGDDQKMNVQTCDLAILDDAAYCHECGQVGCTHDGRDRE